MTDALTPRDLDLLRAAFESHADAFAAWERWRDGVAWEGPVDAVAFALLPRVRRNLESLGFDDPLFPRFKGIARQAWVGNQRHKAAIGEWISAIPSVAWMALPPTSTLFLDTAAVGTQGRWSHLMVHPEQAALAIRSLLRCGWKPSGLRLPRVLIKGYVLGAGHIPLERADTDTLTLTWRLQPWFGDRVGEAWADSDSVPLGGHSIRCLCRTDAVTFMLRQPVGGDPLRWTSNVLSICSPAVDWSRIRRSLAMLPLSGDCSPLLPILSRFLDGGHTPASTWRWPVVATLQGPAIPAARSHWSRWRQDWATYKAAWGNEYRLVSAVAQLPGYMMGRWHIPSLDRLPRGLVRWL